MINALLHMKNQLPVSINFATTHQYNHLYYALLDTKTPQQILSAYFSDGRMDVDASQIVAMTTPGMDIDKISKQDRIMSIFYESGLELAVFMSGNRRCNQNYEKMKILIGKPVTNAFVALQQDSRHFSLIQHFDKIINILLKDINGNDRLIIDRIV